MFETTAATNASDNTVATDSTDSRDPLRLGSGWLGDDNPCQEPVNPGAEGGTDMGVGANAGETALMDQANIPRCNPDD